MSSKKKTASRNTSAANKEAAPPVAMNVKLPEGFKVKRQVTLPSLALKQVNVSRVLRINDEMRISKIQDKPDAQGKKREPATICTVTDLETGVLYTLIVPAVVKANLERDYPDGKYVGLAFQITNMGKRSESQRYNDYQILEVEAA
jgi:hypothetical protein